MNAVIASNIKFLRRHKKLKQEDFGKLFNLTRHNIDSYERGKARPSEEKALEIGKYFGLDIEVLHFKDLNLNPGLLIKGGGIQNSEKSNLEEVIRSKDKLIEEQSKMIVFLKSQIETLTNIINKTLEPNTIKHFSKLNPEVKPEVKVIK